MCSWDKLCTKDTKRTKNLPTVISEDLGAKKQGVQSKSRVLSTLPALNTTRGVDKTLKPPLWPDPWTPPMLTPYKEPAHFPPTKGASEQGNL